MAEDASAGPSTGEIFAATWQLIRRHPTPAVAAVTFPVGMTAALDWAWGLDRFPVDSLIVILVQFWVTRLLIDARGLRAAEGGGGPLAFIGAALLSGLGIGLGIIALVVPGLLLAARWFVALPMVVANGAGPGSALTDSWDLVKGNTLQVLGVVVFLTLPSLALTAALYMKADSPLASSLTVPGFAAVLLLNVAAVAGWYAAVAYFEMRGAPRHRLTEIFA